MRKRWLLAGATVLAAITATGGVAVMSSAKQTAPAEQQATANTLKVEKGNLSAMVSVDGNLTYRARSDGSPYSVINQASGIYTNLPAVGDKVHCGDVLYRVNDRPVLLLCGAIPAYRDVHPGDAGNDVGQLNQNLHGLGYDTGAAVDPRGDQFTANTQKALEALQHDKGLDVTGELHIHDVVFLPDSVRIAKVTGELGGSAQPGAPVLYATSDSLEVQVDLDASQQGEVQEGDRAQISLPGNQSMTGTVDRLGSVAQVPTGPTDNAGQNSDPGDAILPAYIGLDDPGTARGLDEAPVQVDITTNGVESALSVPVTAIVGKSGGGFAVEVVRDGARRDLVGVELGLFDSAGERVQVEGDLHEGDRVVVPSL